jgi:hypothetical protein
LKQEAGSAKIIPKNKSTILPSSFKLPASSLKFFEQKKEKCFSQLPDKSSKPKRKGHECISGISIFNGKGSKGGL